MENPKISIVTVTFNAEMIIKKTIDSILSQDYTNIESIIIDGDSTDSTLEYIKLNQNRITKVVSEKDGGIYDAMNKGFKISTGDFVIFMNAGDLFVSKNTISSVVDKITDLNSIYYGNAFYVSGSVNKSTKRGGGFNKYRLAQTNICHQTILYPRFLFDSQLYNLTYKLFADWEYNMRAYKLKVKFIYIDIDIAYYDINGVSITQKDYNFERDLKKIVLLNLGLLPIIYLGYRKIINYLK